MTDKKHPTHPTKPLRESVVPNRKRDHDESPAFSEKPDRRIFDVTDTRPAPANPHRNSGKEENK